MSLADGRLPETTDLCAWCEKAPDLPAESQPDPNQNPKLHLSLKQAKHLNEGREEGGQTLRQQLSSVGFLGQSLRESCKALAHWLGKTCRNGGVQAHLMPVAEKQAKFTCGYPFAWLDRKIRMCDKHIMVGLRLPVGRVAAVPVVVD